MGFPPIGIITLDIELVIGVNRVPSPAANKTAFIVKELYFLALFLLLTNKLTLDAYTIQQF